MKNILENIKNVINENYFSMIDAEIVNESLKEEHLLEIAKYLKNIKTYKRYGSQKNTFKDIFGRISIEWDKITEDDFDKYRSGDKNGIKQARKIGKNGDDFINQLILFMGDNDTIEAFATCNGITWMHRGEKTKKYNYDNSQYEDYDKSPSTDIKITQKIVSELCNQYDFWILEINKFRNYKKRNERTETRSGMLINDEWYYDQIARENKQRYEKIIAKRKAERQSANDDISPKVKEILDKIMDLSSKIMKGGVKYVDCASLIERALDMCYRKKYYDSGARKTFGSDGLLILYKEYIDSNTNALKAQYTFSNDASKFKKPILEIIDKIEEIIKEIEEKL